MFLKPVLQVKYFSLVFYFSLNVKEHNSDCTFPHVFQNSNVTVYQQIGKYMKEHPEVMVNDNNLGVKLANEGNYAFFMESTTIEYVIERNCNLTQVGGQLDEKGYGIAMRKSMLCDILIHTVSISSIRH